MYYRKRSKLLDDAKNMPPLRHSIPGERFDIRNSEVMKWLIQRPDILNYLWDHVKSTGYVTYENGVWKGTNYGG